MITRVAEVNGEKREAVFSDDELYRLRLDITWDASNPRTMTTIALNPSTADHLIDDPTIRRGKAFAKGFGCGTYRMLNAFALRSTDYKALFRAKDPIGPDNTLEFLKFWAEGTLTIACWGAHITERPWKHFYRGHEIAGAINHLYALSLTQSGHPAHPLYLKGDCRTFPFEYAK